MKTKSNKLRLNPVFLGFLLSFSAVVGFKQTAFCSNPVGYRIDKLVSASIISSNPSRLVVGIDRAFAPITLTDYRTGTATLMPFSLSGGVGVVAGSSFTFTLSSQGGSMSVSQYVGPLVTGGVIKTVTGYYAYLPVTLTYKYPYSTTVLTKNISVHLSVNATGGDPVVNLALQFSDPIFYLGSPVNTYNINLSGSRFAIP